MNSRLRISGLLVVAALAAASGPIGARQQGTISQAPLPDVDVRDSRPAAAPTDVLAAQGPPARSRQSRLHPHTGAVRLLERPGITAPRGGSAAALRGVVASAGGRLGLERSDLDSLAVIRDYTSQSTGLRHVVYRQSFGGIDVFDGIVAMHVDGSGSVVRITSSAARGANRPQAPLLSAADAAIEAARSVLPDSLFLPAVVDGPTGAGRRTRFARGPFRENVNAELTWFALDGSLRLAWHVTLEPDGIPQFYDVVIDAESGELLLRRNRVQYDEGTGRVMQSNATQLLDPRLPDQMPGSAGTCPPPLNHELRNLTTPFRDAAAVLGNTGGLEGNNTIVLRGNNSTPGATGTSDGTQWIFDFPFNSNGASETSLFFALNYAHDFFYDLGFDEAAGNFQADNFGRGGAGGDALRVVSRAAGRNNATFQPMPEGSSPVISVFLWDGIGCWAEDVDSDGLLDIDGGYDLDIVLHEFHHGVSHRLNTAFTGNEANAIGEGGSDFFAYSVNGDTTLAEYSRPGGLRQVNEKTYGDWFCLFGFICEPHANGEIFANVLWDVRERFRADLVRGSEAAAINEVHQLYVDALKLSPPAPTMLDIRDAMLQADTLRNPGSGESENFCRIWEPFAARGMGVNATDTADNGSNQVGPDASVPPGCDAPPPPPTLTLTVGTATATEAGPTTGTFTISRGEVRDSPTNVGYTISGSAGNGTDYATIAASAVIPAGASSVDVTITPIDDLLVESDETVTLKLKASSAYVLGTPSTGTVTIVSDDTAPDLVVSKVVAPSTAGAGDEIVVSDTTKNQGTGAADESVTSFFLSTNISWDAGDTPLGSRTVGALGVDESSTVSTTLTLPTGLAPGTYFILAKADGPGTLSEISESNNVRSDSTRIGPDLDVSALSVPAAAGPGATISINDTTKNLGGGAAGASSTRFYFSTNGSVDDGDILLGARAVPALAGGAASAATTSVTLPGSIETGTYYIVATADGDNDVAETSESNNARYDQIRIGPDLKVSSIAVPARGAAGAAIAITETTQNVGQAPAGASTTAYYLSSNWSLDGADVKLSPARAVGPLAAGASSSGVTSVVLPDVAAGTWYVIAAADDAGVVLETFENNNTKYDTIKIGPDFDVTAVSAPSSAAAGATVSVSTTVKNIGADTAPPSTVRFYLSLNASFDTSDVPLNAERAIPALAPNSSSAGATAVTLPSGVSGKHYIIVVADPDGTVAETTETNNTMARAITINP